MPAKFLPPVFAALVFSLLIYAAPALSQQTPAADEKYLLDAVNRERAGERIPPLKWDANLAAAARAHAREMVARNRLSHQFPGEADLTARAGNAGARFSSLAENVAEAPSVDELHIGWMNSLPHRTNIMNPKLTSIGIAVEMRGEQYFAVQDFSTAVGALSREEQEKQVGRLIEKQGLKISSSPEDARKACDSSSYSGARPLAILHFEAPDLNQLPGEVASAIRKGPYKTAAVGSCTVANRPGGFSHFRIAILLY